MIINCVKNWYGNLKTHVISPWVRGVIYYYRKPDSRYKDLKVISPTISLLSYFGISHVNIVLSIRGEIPYGNDL